MKIQTSGILFAAAMTLAACGSNDPVTITADHSFGDPPDALAVVDNVDDAAAEDVIDAEDGALRQATDEISEVLHASDQDEDSDNFAEINRALNSDGPSPTTTTTSTTTTTAPTTTTTVPGVEAIQNAVFYFEDVVIEPSDVDSEVGAAILAELNAMPTRWADDTVNILMREEAGDVSATIFYEATAAHPIANPNNPNARTAVRITYTAFLNSIARSSTGVVLDDGGINACFNWDTCPDGLTRDDFTIEPNSEIQRVGQPLACHSLANNRNGLLYYEC